MMINDEMIAKILEHRLAEYKYKCDIKKFLVFTIITALFSIYYVIVDRYDNIGLLIVFLMATGGLLTYTIQLVEKKSDEINKLNLLCLKTYGKNYHNSRKEVEEDTFRYYRKK